MAELFTAFPLVGNWGPGIRDAAVSLTPDRGRLLGWVRDGWIEVGDRKPEISDMVAGG